MGSATADPPLTTSVDTVTPYVQTNPPIDITATGNSTLDNVTLWYRYAGTNDTWNWSYKKELTINSSQVDTSLTHFIILINITDTDLRDHAQSDGGDILFTNGSAKLNHEVELYNSTTGQLVAWLNITDLPSDEDKTLYMYYGNPACSNQENITGTWHSDYEMVHHFNETSGDAIDSTINYNNGTLTSVTQGEDGIAGLAYNCPTGGYVTTTLSSYSYTHCVWMNTGDKWTFYVNNDTSSFINGSYSSPIMSAKAGSSLSGFEDNYGSSSIYSDTDIDIDTMGCSGQKAFLEARSWCEGIGARLPTLTEVENDETRGMGCGYDTEYIWTSTPCTSGYYVDEGKAGGVGAKSCQTPSSSYYVRPVADDPTQTTASSAFSEITNLKIGEIINATIDEVRVINRVLGASEISTMYNSIVNATDGGFFSLGEEEATLWTRYEADTVSPWNWSFPCTNGSGYYQLYSIGWYGGSNESGKSEPDSFFQLSNTPPSFSNPDPDDGSDSAELNASQGLEWSITINDPEGGTFNWTIECNNTQSSSGNTETNGTKSISLTTLNYETTYTIWVNATDGLDSANETYTFKTERLPKTRVYLGGEMFVGLNVTDSEPDPIRVYFGGEIHVSQQVQDAQPDPVRVYFGGNIPVAGPIQDSPPDPVRFYAGGEVNVTYNMSSFTRYSDDWSYYKNITFNDSQIPSDQSYFPVCINLTDTDLMTKAQADGDDILFANNFGTKLNHYIEKWDNTTGRLVAWVNVTHLDADLCRIYMYYGNTECANQESSPDDIWYDYLIVCHYNANGTDSMGNYDGTTGGNTNFFDKGRLGGSACFDGTNDYITYGDVSEMDTPSTFTVTIFWNRDSDKNSASNHNVENVLVAQSSDSSNDNFEFGSDGTSIDLYIDTGSDSADDDVHFDESIADDTWYVSTVSYNSSRSSEAITFLNGVNVDERTFPSGSLQSSDGSPLSVGIARPGDDEWGDFNGTIDEFRLSMGVKTDDWIVTEHNSIANATDGGFYTLGEEIIESYFDVSNPTPNNGSTVNYDVSSWNITITYQNGTFNWTIETVPDVGSDSATGDSNGTKGISLSSVQNNVTYTVYVNATDTPNGNSANEWYTFTGKNHPVFLSNPNPANGSSVPDSQSAWNITMNEPEGDTFYWSIDTFPDVGNATNSSDVNGTKGVSLSGLSEGQTYTVYVNTSDGTHNTNQTYTFNCSDWWNASWSYRQPILISNPIDGYQSKLIIGNSSGGDVNCSGYAKNNFDDIRFVVANGTVLPHWIENVTVDTIATIWFRNEYNDTSLYMYYGNNNAENISNGTATFPWHFENWTTDTTGDYTEDTRGDGHGKMWSMQTTISDDFRMRVRFRPIMVNAGAFGSSNLIGPTQGTDADLPGDRAMFFINCDTDNGASSTVGMFRTQTYDGVTSDEGSYISLSENNWYITESNYSYTDTNCDYICFDDTYTEKYSKTHTSGLDTGITHFGYRAANSWESGSTVTFTQYTTDPGYVRLQNKRGSLSEHYTDVDWAFIAMYNSTEPTITFEELDTNEPPTVTSPQCMGQTNPDHVTNHTPYFTWTISDNQSDAQGSYELEIGDDSDWTVAEIYDSGEISNTSDNVTYNGSTPLYDGWTYYWRVRLKDDNGSAFGDWCATQNFVMNDAPSMPTLTSPGNNSLNLPFTTNSVNLTWTASTDNESDSKNYYWQYARNSDFTLDKVQDWSGGPTYETIPNSGNLEKNTWYYWRVRAWDGTEYSDYTGWRKFYTDSNDPVNSDPYPAEMATDIPLSISTLNITVNDDGNSMNVYFRTNESGTWKTAQTNTSVTNGTYYCLNTSWIDSNGTKYWWSVNTSDTEGRWDNDTYYFTTEVGDNSVIYVNDDANGDWYDATHVATISEAITNVSNGGIVYVWEGTYTNSVTVDKNCSIIGNSSALVSYEPSGSGFSVTNDSVNISGIFVYGTGGESTIFSVDADNVYLHNLTIFTTGSVNSGLASTDTSVNLTVDNVTISTPITHFKGENLTIKNCTVNETGQIECYGVETLTITGCYIHNDSAYGVYLADYGSDNTSNATIRNCIFENNSEGIQINNEDNENILIYNNIFRDNTVHVDDETAPGHVEYNISETIGTNIVGGSNLGGNYWDNYTGYDTDGDGLGEASVTIRNNTDYLPLLTEINSIVEFSNPNPSNKSSGVSTSISTWNITITDPDFNTFDWSIDTFPDVGNGSGTTEMSGSKQTTLTGLAYSTNYSVYVNASDGTEAVNESFWFITEAPTDTIYVDDDADPGWYDGSHVATVTEGVANVSDSGTIYVWAGTYNEGDILIGKNCSIIGNGSASSIQPTIRVNATHVNLTDINITGDANGIEFVGWSAGSSPAENLEVNLVVTNCTINASIFGITDDDYYMDINCTVLDTNITLNDNYEASGLYFYTDTYDLYYRNIIVNNTEIYFIDESTDYSWGLRFRGDNLTITNSSISMPADDDNFGIQCMNSSSGCYGEVIIMNNTIASGYGIVFGDHQNMLIKNNTIGTDNLYALGGDSSQVNVTVYNNYFDGSVGDVTGGLSGITWNTSKTAGSNIYGGSYLGGNYWGGYAGTDVNNDGIGDTQVPYNASGNITDSGDYLPLTSPSSAEPVFSNPNPANQSTYVEITVDTWNITITDPTESFNWSIETLPNVGSNSSNNDASGSKEATVTLAYDTNYTVFVNATNGYNTTNETFWFVTKQSPPDVVYVDDDADGSWYNQTQVATIQEGMDNVSTGGLVYVYNGSYSCNLTYGWNVSKELTIQGDYRSNVTCNTTKDYLWTIFADNVTIENLSMYSNASYEYTRFINVEADNFTLQNCSIESDEVYYFVTAVGNENLNVNNISVTGPFWLGFFSLQTINHLRIENITVDDLSTDTGIALYQCNDTIIQDCSLKGASTDMIGISGFGDPSGNLTIRGNYIENSEDAIELNSGNFNDLLLYNNYFSNNTDHISGTWSSVTFNVSKTAGVNIVGGEYLGGNYWDNYTGVDTNDDGLGDTLTPVYGDELPLISGIFYVDDDYTASTPGWEVSRFERISDAVENASDGTLIYVYNGTYTEWDITPTVHNLTIIGNSTGDTQVWGGYVASSDVFILDSITDFTIEGLMISGAEECGIDATNITRANISNNYFIYNRDEHIELHKSYDCEIWNNTFYNDIDGYDTTAIEIARVQNMTIINNYFDGNGSMYRAVELDDVSSAIKTENITISQNYINATDGVAIDITMYYSDAYNLTIRDNDIYNFARGMGVGGVGSDIYNISIINNTFYNGTTDYGIEINNVHSVIMDDLYFLEMETNIDSDEGCINLYYDCFNVSITNSTFINTTQVITMNGQDVELRHLYMANWEGVGAIVISSTGGESVNDVDIYNVTIINGSTVGEEGGNGIVMIRGADTLQDVNISYSTIDDCPVGIKIEDSMGGPMSEIADNQTFYTQDPADIENITVHVCDISNVNYGIWKTDGDAVIGNLTIEYCEINATYRHTWLYDVQYVDILSNTLHNQTDNRWISNMVYYGSYVNCSFNTMENNSGGGFYSFDVDNLTFYNNIVWFNNEVGLYPQSCDEGLVYNNYFSNPSADANAYNCSNTNFRFNTTKHAGTNIIGGAWMFGNYWHDYAGVDDDEDGIGDTPYEIICDME